MTRDGDTYLTEAEVTSLTGKVKRSAQRAWLRKKGYPFLPDAAGAPVILREEAKATPLRHTISESGLLTEQEIVRRAKRINKICGVYFLVCGGGVIYIGKSLHVMERIAKHTRSGDMAFDAFYYIRTTKSALSSAEAAYILALRPRANVIGVNRR